MSLADHKPTDEQYELLYRKMPEAKGATSFTQEDARSVLEIWGVSIPGHEFRTLVGTDVTKPVQKEQVEEIYASKQLAGLRSLYQQKGSLKASADASFVLNEEIVSGFHTVSKPEQDGYSRWINQALDGDIDLVNILPIDTENENDLYEKTMNGILMCKIINSAVPKTIDERSINKGKKAEGVFCMNENLTLAINSAAAVGCCVVNVGPEDLRTQRRHIVLGLIWQLIRKKLIESINLLNHKNLVNILPEGTDPSELLKMTPEQILMMWVNYHLKNAGSDRVMTNFHKDLGDSHIYSTLMDQIAPEDLRSQMKTPGNILASSDTKQRADDVLDNSSNVLKVPDILCSKDIYDVDKYPKQSSERLHTAFLATLFNMYPGLEGGPGVTMEEETLEEKTYRNWMNSLGVKPFVNHLYTDLCSGCAFLELIDHIKPNTVDWSKVVRKFSPKKEIYEKQGNCQMVITCAEKINIQMVNVDGDTIRKGENKKIIMGVCFRLMHAYTLQLLDKASKGNAIDALTWSNMQLKECGNKELTSYRDDTLASGCPVLAILEHIHPGATEAEIWKSHNPSVPSLEMCTYAISCCRKAGARVYALPEHLNRLEGKLIQTVLILLQALKHA